ncbi:MAG: hypothetical protein M1817_003227 [Caeruleum heppii]|nr:MAG: hypothetical protein M1817_003227 [Caeruleum heppii]
MDSPFRICASCLKVRVLKAPCSRAKIPDIVLFRLGLPKDDPLRCWTERQEVFQLRDVDLYVDKPRKLLLTQDLGHTLMVSVGPFLRGATDHTSYIWEDKEGQHELEMPPYVIINMEEGKRNVIDYHRHSRASYIEHLTDGCNSMIQDTFRFAIHFTREHEGSLLRQALDLWAASRLIERPWRICGPDTLGQEPVAKPGNPWNGIIPVTPVMDTQLDQVVIQEVLHPIAASVTRMLERKIAVNHREDFFEIYLTIFVLLNNFEWMLAATREFAQRYGMSGRLGPRGKYSVCESHLHTAKILLAHFHFVCRGSVPFSLAHESLKALKLKNIGRDQLQLMQQTQEKVKNQEESLRALQKGHKYETEMYLAHQIYFADWDSSPTYIEELPDDD